MPISKIKSSAIDANAITGAGIADGTVDTADLAAGAVTSAKLDTNIDIAGTLDVTGTLTADSNIAAGSTVTAIGGMTSSATSGGNIILATNGGTTNSDTAVFQGNAGSYYNQMFLYGSGESYFQTNGTSLTFGTVSNNPVYIKSNNGNVLRIDSDGLKFGSDTAAANALDDYEEGLHVVTMSADGGGTVSTQSGAERIAYTKIGRQVTITGDVRISSVSGVSGNTLISLPFSVGNFTDLAERGGLLVNVWNGSSWTIQRAFTSDNQSNITVQVLPAAGYEYRLTYTYFTN